jgi:hypothetical protein
MSHCLHGNVIVSVCADVSKSSRQQLHKNGSWRFFISLQPRLLFILYLMMILLFLIIPPRGLLAFSSSSSLLGTFGFLLHTKKQSFLLSFRVFRRDLLLSLFAWCALPLQWLYFFCLRKKERAKEKKFFLLLHIAHFNVCARHIALLSTKNNKIEGTERERERQKNKKLIVNLLSLIVSKEIKWQAKNMGEIVVYVHDEFIVEPPYNSFN